MLTSTMVEIFRGSRKYIFGGSGMSIHVRTDREQIKAAFRMIRTGLLGVFGLLVPVCLQALPFNSKLSKSELETINAGQVLIRNTGAVKHMCISTDNADVNSALKIIKDLNPAYLAEVIQVRPVQGNEDILSVVRDILVDIPSYVGIPYWSERGECYYDLYSDGKITSQTQEGDTEHITAVLEMDPFGDIGADITVRQTADFLSYANTNTNDLYYKDSFKCVKTQNMKSLIVVFRDGDNWILYGIGGVDAPKVFFLKKRIETSFINRIKTFCNFVFQKL